MVTDDVSYLIDGLGGATSMHKIATKPQGGRIGS